MSREKVIFDRGRGRTSHTTGLFGIDGREIGSWTLKTKKMCGGKYGRVGVPSEWSDSGVREY